MSLESQIKKRLNRWRWCLACRRLKEFIERIRYDYGDIGLGLDDVEIVEVSNPAYFFLNHFPYSSAMVLKKGYRKYGSNWLIAVFYWSVEFPDRNVKSKVNGMEKVDHKQTII